MNSKVRGTLCGILAAACYGANPLGALPLYADGINSCSVLFYRFSLAVLMLALYMAVQRKSFAVTRHELAMMAGLGVLFSSSSLSLFNSFHFMGAGIACTLLFVYPIMVAVIMAVFFKEKVTASTVLSIVLALTGIALLYKGGDGETLSGIGVSLVTISSLTYALYIIVVNSRRSVCRRSSSRFMCSSSRPSRCSSPRSPASRTTYSCLPRPSSGGWV